MATFLTETVGNLNESSLFADVGADSLAGTIGATTGF